jgi:hypothetical protein
MGLSLDLKGGVVKGSVKMLRKRDPNAGPGGVSGTRRNGLAPRGRCLHGKFWRLYYFFLGFGWLGFGTVV